MRFAVFLEGEAQPLARPLLILWALIIRKQLHLVILITTEKQTSPPQIGEPIMIFIFSQEPEPALSEQHLYLVLTAEHLYLFLHMILTRTALPILQLRPT